MDKEQVDAKDKSDKKTLAIGIAILAVLVIIGVAFHVTDDSPPVAQEFFENRKAPEDFHEYQKSEMSNKEKAERNIFLQD